MKMILVPALLSLASVFALTTATFTYCFGINAAFTFRDTQFFIYGFNWMVGFDNYGQVVYSGHVDDIGYRDHVTAAVGVKDEDMFYLLSGRGELGFNSFRNYSEYYPLYWSGADEKLAENPDYYGIDAAFERPNSTVVYFAGCEYAEVDAYHMSYIGKGNMSDLNLPCHVDAAWSSPDQQVAYIASGFNLWRWFVGEDTVDGPHHLFHFFNALSVFLCPGSYLNKQEA